jgi:predicted CXXCH cytochrome family protein
MQPLFMLRLFLAVLALSLAACDDKSVADTTAATATVTAAAAPAKVAASKAHYVGSDECQVCHNTQTQDWNRSHHHQAMTKADDTAMLGNFSAGTLEHHQQQSRFEKTVDPSSTDQYVIKTDRNTASPAELPLQYSFGVFPLQQYLTALPDGRLQSLPFAWDARPATEQGQRWFHLYASEPVVPGDVLHWRQASHTANHMCIECHTTNFDKNYHADSDTYTSQWQEVGVGCESCHGPGSNHIAWTRSEDKSAIAHKGWDFTMTSGSQHLWQHQTSTSPALRTTSPDSIANEDMQVERCAQCHSRRSRIAVDNDKKFLLDAFLPALLDETLYYADGQIQDEVFEYGSFIQSRMHKKGVTCSNCHNPHSGDVKEEGNGLCLQCHNTSYDTPQHHFHQEKTAGSFCVDCHMPATTYMQVDARRDHSLRIPRPDLTESIGTPNACNQCHSDKDAAWASQTLDQHSGKSSDKQWRKPHYGEILQKARLAQPAVYDAIVTLIKDNTQTAIVRATAVSLLPNFRTRDYRVLLNEMLGNNEALIRLGALRAAESLPPQERTAVAFLLNDSLLAIRIEAARLLSALPEMQQNIDYQRARKEYVNSQNINSDRAASLVNLSALALNERQPDTAEQYLLAAIKKEPYYIPASINLVDFYRQTQRDKQGESVLLAALKQVSDNADLHLSYGLWLVRNQRTGEAMTQLQAAANQSRDPYMHYVYALALQQQGDNSASQAELDKAAALPAYNRDVHAARVDIAVKNHNIQQVQQALAAWKLLDAQDPAIAEWEKRISL